MSIHYDRGKALYSAGKYEHAERELRKALEESPRDAENHTMLSFTLSELDKLEEAADEAKQSIGLDPESYRGFHALALALKLLGTFDAAESAIRAAISLEPEYARLHSMLSNILYNQMRFKESLESAELACHLDPSSPSALQSRADALMSLDRIDEAKECIKAALDIDPMSVSGHIASGRHALVNENYAEAIAECREALRLSPNDDSTHYSLACALTNSGQHQEAHTHILESIRLNPRDVWSHCLFAEILDAEGWFDEAIKAAQRGVECAPEHFKPHSTLAYLYHKSSKLTEAEAEARKSIELKPENYSGNRSLVNILLARHKVAEARHEAENYVEKFPSAQAYALLLACVATEKQTNRFQELIDKGLALDSCNMQLLETASTAFFHSGNFEASLRYSERLLEIRPNRIQAVHTRIVSLLKLKRYDEALAHIEEAIKEGKDLPSLYVNRGILFYEQAKSKEAIADLEKALEIDPANKTAQDNLLLILNCGNPIYKGLGKLRNAVGKVMSPIFPAASAPAYLKLIKLIMLPFACAIALTWLLADSILCLCNLPFLLSNPIGRKLVSGKYVARHVFILIICIVAPLSITHFGTGFLKTGAKIVLSLLSIYMLGYLRSATSPAARPRVGCAGLFLVLVFNVWLWSGKNDSQTTNYSSTQNSETK